MTNTTPPSIPQDIVVVGSSAGGIEALTILLGSLPDDFGAPLVIAQHLDPKRQSSLPEILQRATTLPVVLVQEHTPLKTGTVYVVPANQHVVINDHAVELEGENHDRPRPSVNLLLASAAEVFGERLIAVILSGTGDDGADGAIHVKRAGGTVIVQNPATARFAAMPSALSPSVVDYVANVEDIGAILVDILKGIRTEPTGEKGEQGLQEILEKVGQQTHIDFRLYKASTIIRRIGRRMMVTQTHSMREYVQFLDLHPDEVGELASAFLINVTQFFRDPDAFTFLREQVLPALIAQARGRNHTLRLWSAGCATGEEPYSLAMLVCDMLKDELEQWVIKLFATDVDEAAIQFARQGVYAENALQGLPPSYRERFFECADGAFRITKALRQTIIFGSQDLSRSPAFPNIDLVVCRNVLIYFKSELQDYVLGQFNFSLQAQRGYILLGKAETVRPNLPYFELIDKQWKVYRSVSDAGYPTRRGGVSEWGRTPVLTPRQLTKAEAAPAVDGVIEIVQLRRFNEQVLGLLPLGMVVIDRAYRVLMVNAAARRLLGFRDKTVEQDFLHAVRGLPYDEVRDAIDVVFRQRVTTTLPELQLLGDRNDGHFLSLLVASLQNDLAIIMVSDVTEQVQTRRTLETAQQTQQKLVGELAVANRRLGDANKEFGDANEELQVTNEELMLTHEELQATIEEFETTTEELQATNEEMETSNEELQATNEELETTNDELRARTSEVQLTANQLESRRRQLNELVQTAPFSILVLRGPFLVVEACNPRLQQEAGDIDVVGQLFQDMSDMFGEAGPLVLSLAREAYQSNAERSTPRLRVKHIQQSKPLEFFVYSLVPSHDHQGKVDGVVVFAVNVTAQYQQEISEEFSRLQAIFERAEDVALALYDASTAQLLTASALYTQLLAQRYDRTTTALGQSWLEFPLVVASDEAAQHWDKAVHDKRSTHIAELRLAGPNGSGETMWRWSLTPFINEGADAPEWVLVSLVDITTQVRQQEKLEELDMLKDEFLSLASHELRTPLTSLLGYTGLLQKSLEQMGGDDRISVRTRRIAAQFKGQLDRLHRLIDDLTDIVRLQSGKLSLAMQTLDLCVLVTETVEVMRITTPVPLETKLCEETLHVRGDTIRLAQVVTNLITNALTHAKNTPRIIITTERTQANNQPWVDLVVQDFGPGVPAQALPHLFDRFYQVTRANDHPIIGLGLGLFICKQLVEQHGGTITVVSQEGQGAAFTVRLPLLAG